MESWLFFAAASIAAATALYFGFRYLIRARLIENTPTARVRSAHQGYVELNGIARSMAGEPIRAPLTGVQCCWYRIRVERRGDKRWSTREQETSGHLFLLQDASGACIIDPDGAHVTPSDRSVWYGSSRHPLQPDRSQGQRTESLMAQVAKFLNKDISGGQQRYRYTEERIFQGDPLYAIGQFKTQDELDRRESRRELMLGLLRDWKQTPESLLSRFDSNRNGQIDSGEWETARRTANREAADILDRQQAGQIPNLLSRPDSIRYPYILSTDPEFAMVRRFRWLAAANFGLFLIAGTLAVWLLGTHPS